MVWDRGGFAGFAVLELAYPQVVNLMNLAVTSPGRGEGRALIRAALDVAFRDMSAHRLFCDIAHDNEAALAAFAAAGLQREGTMRHCWLRAGIGKIATPSPSCATNGPQQGVDLPLRPPALRHTSLPVTDTETRRGGQPMAMEGKDIETLIRAAFPQAKITVIDTVGDGNHWAAEVIDESFRGMNRVQQQRAVYASLKGKMDGAQGELHALALTTKAPD